MAIGCCVAQGWTSLDCCVWLSVGVATVGCAVATVWAASGLFHWAISFWFACCNILSCKLGSSLALNDRINKQSQSNTVEIQIQIHATVFASDLSEKAITKNNIINNIHKVRIHRQNFCSSLFVML